MNNKIEYKKLGEIIETLNAGFACNKKNEIKDGYVHLRTNNISPDGTLNLSKIIKIGKEKVDKKKSKLEKGDILFNNTNSKELVGKTCIVKKNYDFAYSNHLTKIKTKKYIEPTYLAYYLNYLFYKGYFLKNCKKWIGQAGFNSTQLKDIPVPVIAIEEQKRLVRNLDEIFINIKSALELVEENILLTKQNLDTYLNITYEKLFNKFEIKEIRDSLEYLTDYHANGSYEILKKNVTLKDKKDYALMIRATDLENKKFDRDVRFISKKAYEFLKKTKVFGDEIIVPKIGSIGNVYIMPKLSKPVSLGMNLFMLKLKKDYLPKFIYYYLFSSNGRKELTKRAKGAVTKTITKNAVKEISIPDVKLQKQKEIVSKIELIWKKSNELSKLIIEQQQKLINLKKSILDSAFQNKL